MPHKAKGVAASSLWVNPVKTKLKRKKKSGAPRANKKKLSALADAIAQMEKWASDRVRVTLIFAEETHAVHHVGRLIKIDDNPQQFQFVSNSGMLVWLMPKSWTKVERETVPQFINSIHVIRAGPRRRVLLTLIESDLLGQESRRRRQEEVELQLRTWGQEKTPIYAEIDSGFLAELSLGHVEERSLGVFFLHRLESRSFMLLDVSRAGFASLIRDQDSCSVVLQDPTYMFRISLSDKLSEGVREAVRPAPTDSEREEATNQLKSWAHEGIEIMYGSGNKITDVLFAGKLVGPQEDGSFIVKGAVVASQDGSQWRLGGRVVPNEAERISILREASSVAIFFRCGNDTSYIADIGQSKDALLAMQDFSKWIH
jgi:hypothetical protein